MKVIHISRCDTDRFLGDPMSEFQVCELNQWLISIACDVYEESEVGEWRGWGDHPELENDKAKGVAYWPAPWVKLYRIEEKNRQLLTLYSYALWCAWQQGVRFDWPHRLRAVTTLDEFFKGKNEKLREILSSPKPANFIRHP